jgi:cobalamin biosynthesis protein CbiG
VADAGAGDFALGVGLSSGAGPAELAALVDATLRTAGIARDRITRVGTIDTRATHPALTHLGWPVVAFTPAQLAATAGGGGGPGRGPVAEPAALLAAGPGAVLVVRKRRSARATVAVARAGRPRAAHTPS